MSKSSIILNYEATGNGSPTVVFLHGMVGSHRYWQWLLPPVARYRHTVAVDLLGFGDSPKPPELNYTFADHILSIRTTLDMSGARPPYVLVGHSMGALLALTYAKTHPEEIQKVLLISMPIFASPQEASKMLVGSGIIPNMMIEGRTARIACALMCRFRPLVQNLMPYYYRHLPRDIAIDATKHTWYSYSKSLENILKRQNALEDLRRLSVPCTLLLGSKDRLMKFEHLERVPKHITVRVIEGAGHHLPLEMPDEVRRWL